MTTRDMNAQVLEEILGNLRALPQGPDRARAIVTIEEQLRLVQENPGLFQMGSAGTGQVEAPLGSGARFGALRRRRNQTSGSDQS